MSMSRNHRRHTTKPSKTKAIHQTITVTPDFEPGEVVHGAGILLPAALKGAEFSVNGKRREIKIDMQPGSTALDNSLIFGIAVGYFMSYTMAPKATTAVKFAPVDFNKWENFFTEMYQLESALCSSGIDTDIVDAISLQRLADYVPSYRLVDGKEHIRLRDCIEFLDYARFDDELMTAMKK